MNEKKHKKEIRRCMLYASVIVIVILIGSCLIKPILSFVEGAIIFEISYWGLFIYRELKFKHPTPQKET